MSDSEPIHYKKSSEQPGPSRKFRTDVARGLYHSLTSHIKLEVQSASDSLRELVLHISEGCNMRCAYCFADKGHYGRTIARFMSPQTATQCIDHIVDTYRRIEKVKIIGGEPLLNCNTLQSALDALRQVVSDGRLESMPKIILNTNLTVGVNRLSSLLRDYPMAITVSLDGPEYIHDEFRRFSNGKGSFQIVDSNIRSLLSTTGQRILLEVVYHPNHLEYGFAMPDVHSFLEERYGSVDVFLHPVSGGKASFKGADHQPTPDSWHRYTTQMFELSQSYGRFLVQDAINSNQLDHLINLFIDLMRITEGA